MRLSLTTFLASTLAFFPMFSSLVYAIHPHVLPRREHPSSSLVFSSRQHRVTRTILDLCINVNVDLLADASQSLPLGLGSNIQLCLCLKDLDVFLDTNVDIKALVGLLGKKTVSALITALIHTSPDASQCLFPPHTHHTCNNNDPCHYECDAHYVRVGNTCICAPPYTSCNGNCDIFPKGCGSAVPRSFKARNEPITTIAQAKATCKPHETVCGIPGREHTLDFECIDIDIADDSCGGCMAPQPFFEVDPILHVSGMDCTRILNAKISQCFGQRCIVRKCKVGWLPNPVQDTCILDTDGSPKLRKVPKLEDSLTTNIVANADVSAGLLAKINTIVKLVSDLDRNLSLSQIPASSKSGVAGISELLSGVNNATLTLIASTTVPSLLNNVDALLDASSLFSSTLSSRGRGTDFGLVNLENALNDIIATLLALKSWCAHKILTGLNLSGLLSGLGLNNSTVAVVSTGLVDQIKLLVHLVNGLASVSSSLPPGSSAPTPPTDSSLINTNIINSIINATIDIVNATTVNSLVSGIGALINVNDLASDLLDHCGCVSSWGLGPLVEHLAQVVNVALEMKDWCDRHPVASSSASAPTSILNNDEVPIDVGLSNLLSLLRPVESGVAISGLGTTTSTQANGPLGGSGSGLSGTSGTSPGSAVITASDVLNPELVTQLKSLLNLVTKLQASYSSGPTSLDASTLLNANLVADIVQKTANLLGSPTVISLLTNIDALIAANSALQTALTNCACTDVLGLDAVAYYLVNLTNATLELKNWCSSLAIPQPVVSALPPSLPPGTTLSFSAASSTIGASSAFTVTSEPTFPVALSSQTAGDISITADADTSVTSELLTKIEGLVGIVLGLTSAGVVHPALSLIPPQPWVPAIAPIIESSLVNNILRAAETLLNVSSVGAIEGEVNGLVVASLAFVKTLDSCGCVNNLGLAPIYASLVQIAKTSLALQDWYRSHSMLLSPSPSSSPVDSHGQSSAPTINPIIVGLTKLLNGLGLPIKKSVAVVDALNVDAHVIRFFA